MQAKRPQQIPTVKWAMTPFPWSLQVNEPIERAKELMGQQDIRHLPVTKQGELVGIVTERDIQIAETLAAKRQQPLLVEDVCAFEPYVVDIGERLDRVVLEMARRRIGSAIVVKQGRLAGIFTATDACRAFGQFLLSMFPDDSGGEAA